jgi:hypothetical protein
VLTNPRQHYFYSKDLSVDGSAKSVSNLIHINTRDVLSIMAVQELLNQFQRYKNEMTNFAEVIEDHSSIKDMVGDEGNPDMWDSISDGGTVDWIARGKKKTGGLHRIKEGSQPDENEKRVQQRKGTSLAVILFSTWVQSVGSERPRKRR